MTQQKPEFVRAELVRAVLDAIAHAEFLAEIPDRHGPFGDQPHDLEFLRREPGGDEVVGGAAPHSAQSRTNWTCEELT